MLQFFHIPEYFSGMRKNDRLRLTIKQYKMKTNDILEYEQRLYVLRDGKLYDCFKQDNVGTIYYDTVSLFGPYRTIDRKEFETALINHGPVSTPEICSKHLALLKLRLEKAWLNVISEKQKELHETHHLRNLLTVLERLRDRLSEKLYMMSEEGHTTCQLNFSISEEILTNGSTKTLGILWDVPNLDGIQRTSLREYLVYLLKKKFTKVLEDESEEKWIERTLCEYCEEVFPHLIFRVDTPCSDNLPILLMEIPIERTFSIL
jgi:hypothetical protein